MSQEWTVSIASFDNLVTNFLGNVMEWSTLFFFFFPPACEPSWPASVGSRQSRERPVADLENEVNLRCFRNRKNKVQCCKTPDHGYRFMWGILDCETPTKRVRFKAKSVAMEFHSCESLHCLHEATYIALGAYRMMKGSVRATSHTRLSARDHYTSSTLIGGRGGAGPSSLHTTIEGPTEWVCECKMDVKSTWIPTRYWMDHVSWSLWTYFKTTSWRQAQHKTARPWHSECSQLLIYSILSCVRTRMDRNSLK